MTAGAARREDGGDATNCARLPDLVAFDFDGVLCDSVDVKTQAFRALYADAGPEVQDALAAYHLRHGGISRDHKIRYAERTLLGRPGDAAAIEARARRFAELVVDQVIAAPMLPGAEACLEHLSGRVPIAVVSGTPEEELRRIVDAKALRPFFDAVCGAPTDKATHLARLIARWQARPQRTVMVGDALTDLSAAKACGTLFLGIRGADGSSPFPGNTHVEADLSDAVTVLAALVAGGAGVNWG
jgi:phosphoglycolate phosphatase-like HAD superfamily hydrolase